jgi:hypothetical protein
MRHFRKTCSFSRSMNKVDAVSMIFSVPFANEFHVNK